MAVPSVNVAVEAVTENQIQEVTLDGQEIYTPQLSMSEQLSKSAHKIDFYKDESEEKGKPTSEGAKEATEEEELVKFQPSLWPWDTVRNKLKAAYTEMSVLSDVLKISKDKRYMLLDNIAGDNSDPKASIQLISKKRALAAGASVLITGAERVRTAQREATQTCQTQPDFHMELMKLRQNWRLRKVGATILGDLSHKSAGSRYHQGGSFEVTKHDVSTPTDPAVTPPCALQVSVPSELEGVSYIQVEVKSIPDSTEITSAYLHDPSSIGGSILTPPPHPHLSPPPDSTEITSAYLHDPSSIGGSILPPDAHWQEKLDASQNVLFCKELFAQLAREAVQLRSSTPHTVIGNQIFTNIFPGVQLSIVLCHYTGNDEKVSSHKPDHNHVLEHSLHQLLRELHHTNSYIPMPHPSTAILGMTKKRRLAGPHAFNIQQLVTNSESKGLLEQIVAQTKHTVLRKRTMDTIDQLAIQYNDLQITSHWTSLNSSLEASVKVIMSCVGYESIRTSLVVIIGVDKMDVIGRDGREAHLSYEQKELTDSILWQMHQHHILTAHALSKMMGWQSLSSNMSSGVGQIEVNGTKASIMLASPTADKILSLTSGISGLRVAVKTIPDPSQQQLINPLVTDEKWANLGGPFVPLELDKLEGKNFANRLELLMACLVK